MAGTPLGRVNGGTRPMHCFTYLWDTTVNTDCVHQLVSWCCKKCPWVVYLRHSLECFHIYPQKSTNALQFVLNIYDWSRNSNPFGSAGFPVTPQEFPKFVEIFVHEPTTIDDLGVYMVCLVIAPGQTQIPDLQFFVTRYGKNHNISINHTTFIFTSELLFQLKLNQASFATCKI